MTVERKLIAARALCHAASQPEMARDLYASSERAPFGWEQQK